jgi:hypothetical protein
MTMKKHELKVWPPFFNDIISGRKEFEVRENDRGFKVGDHLVLKEYDPKTEKYTGFSVEKEIRYILPGGAFGIEEGFCVLQLGTYRPFT